MMTRLLLVSTLVIVTITGTAIADRPADFGKRWVRAHPYALTGLLQFGNFDAEQYRRAISDLAVPWKQEEGLMKSIVASNLPWIGHITARKGPDDKFEQKIAAWMADYKGCEGFIFNDEPNLSGMPDTGRLVAWFRKHHPDLVAMSNALPFGDKPWNYAGLPSGGAYDYETYIEDFIRVIKPDIMMVDIYPFQSQGGPANLFLWNLQVVREKSLAAGIPYWLWVQAYIVKNRRLPSDSDNRMQLFSALTMGFTGLAYFTYDGSFTEGLLIRGEKKSVLFDDAAKANRELRNIAGPIRFLTSTTVRFVKATNGSVVPQGVLAFDKYTHPEPIITNITVEAPTVPPHQPEDEPTYLVDAPYHGGLLGHFRDDDGARYFMLSNLLHSLTARAEEREMTFVIHFDPTVKRVQRVRRSDGEVEQLDVDPENGLTITLPGGTGDLFRISPGPFVGL